MCILCRLIAALLLISTSATAQNRPYRLAVIVPLSGPVATLGEYVKKGILLAYDKLDPPLKKAIELTFEDDQFDAKQTLSAYQRLCADSPLDAIFVLGSPTASALAPITERNKQVLVAIGASDPAIVSNRKYTFIHWVIPQVLGRALAKELARRDFKRIAVVAAEVTGALADANATVDALKELGVGDRIIYNQSFEKTVTDYRTAIAAIKSWDQPDVSVFASHRRERPLKTSI